MSKPEVQFRRQPSQPRFLGHFHRHLQLPLLPLQATRVAWSVFPFLVEALGNDDFSTYFKEEVFYFIIKARVPSRIAIT